jgi:antitoxin component of RelBE/YafQ-DinJ toxin-antitoxin module
MIKDKLITVRVDQGLRESFNQWAKDNDTDASTVIYGFLRRCVDGEIDIDIATGRGKASIDTKQLDDRLGRLETSISELTGKLASLKKK